MGINIILFLLLIILFSIILSKLQNVSQQLQQLTKRLEELKNDENSFAKTDSTDHKNSDSRPPLPFTDNIMDTALRPPAPAIPSVPATPAANAPVQAETPLSVAKPDSEQSISPLSESFTRGSSSPACHATVSPSPLEQRTRELLGKIWNWLIVGEEFRPAAVPMEYAVATVWLVRLGIVLLVIGAVFFLKYSHENNLMPPAFRLAISAIAASGILTVACRFIHSKYRILALGLAGLSLVMLYGVVFAGVHLYMLLPLGVAIPMMLLLTIVGNVLAIRCNAIFLAEVALVGGYATPALLSSGSNNILGLFCYLLLLGGGFLMVAAHKNWKALPIMAFLLTAVYYLVLSFRLNTMEDYELLTGWGCVFFLLFSLMPLLYNLLRRMPITLIELLLQLANAGMFLLVVLPTARELFQNTVPQIAALLPLGMAMYYILIVKYLQIKAYQDRTLLLSCLCLSALGIALTFPLVIGEDYLTLAWASEAVLLLYLGRKLTSKVLESLSILFYLAATLAAIPVLDSAAFSGDGDYLSGVVSRLFSLGALGGGVLAGYLILSKTDRPQANRYSLHQTNLPNRIFFVAALVFLTGWLYLDLSLLADNLYPPALPLLQVTVLLTATFCCFDLQICRNSKMCTSIGVVFLWVIGLHLLYHLLLWQAEPIPTVWFCRMLEILGVVGFLLHLARTNQASLLQRFAGILSGIIWFIYSSLELVNFLQLYLPDFTRGGLSALWGIDAVLLILGGMWKRWKSMRMCGLALFAITAAKALLWDVPQLNTLYRIITLLLVGVAVLAGAWLYLRAEKFFADTTKENFSHDQP